MAVTPRRSRPARSSRRGAPPTEQDSGTRERILDEALRCFAELGFDGSSTRTIAANAGVNQGLIPYYFGSKQALWREAVGVAFGRLGQEIGEALSVAETRGDREAIALLMRRYVRFVAAHPEFVKLMNEEGKREGERMRWLVDTHVRPVFEAMSRLVERAQETRSVPSRIGVPHFQYLFAGAVGTIFHQAPECRRVFGVDPTEPEVVEAHADALVELFLGDASLGREAEATTPERPQ